MGKELTNGARTSQSTLEPSIMGNSMGRASSKSVISSTLENGRKECS